MFIIKLLSQLLILAVGAISVWQAHFTTKPGEQKRRLSPIGMISLAMLLCGLLVFFFTERNERNENAEKSAAQENTILELRRLNQQLTQFSLNRELRELEISFNPSPEQSSRIAEAYRRTKSPVPGVPFRNATMKAERIDDHWRIDFDPVSGPDGVIRFAPVSSDNEEGKPFEDVLRQASSALWIKWGAGVATELEPQRSQFPSAIIVSENTITFVLRPPVLALNLNYLNADSTFTLRGEGNIKAMRFRSQDPQVTFDQMIELNWKEDSGADNDEDVYIKRTKPFISGPHRLQITLKTGT
jgi:hypothetical protein